MLQPGQVVDRYEVEAEIGRGGTAIVYRVRHRTLGSTHALKLLSMAGAELRERVMQEGRLQASLRHPNVVAVTDVIDIDGAPGLIMDHIDGVNLEAWLDQRSSSVEARLAIFREIVAGVRLAHDRGLVHRDLKPANVLMARVEDRWVPKITDFGLAKALQGSSGGPATRGGVAMGTPSYMAPEQIRDARSADRRADVFSLGAMLYRMLLGREPFQGNDVLAILVATTEGRFVPPQVCWPDMPEPLARAIVAALAPDPAQRLQSCEALLAAIDGRIPSSELWRPAAGENHTLAPMDNPSPGGTMVPEYAGPMVTLNVTIVPSPADTVAPAEPPSAPDLSRRSRAPLALALLVALGLAGGLWWWLQTPAAAPAIPAPAPAPVQVAPVKASAAVEVAPAEPAVAVVVPPVQKAPTTTVIVDTSEKPDRSGARVWTTGDASAVWLVSGGRELEVGEGTAVPAGIWDIKASFDGAAPVSAGSATLHAGDSVTVDCVAAFMQCKARRRS